MRYTVSILTFMACLCVAYGEGKPPLEVRRIQDAKKHKIDEIERQYQIALRKQKDLYLMKKDFESVKYIDSLLVEIADAEKQKNLEGRKAHIFCKEDTLRMKSGVWIHPKENAPIHEIPSEYESVKITQFKKRPTEETEAIHFKVKRAGYVKIVVDKSSVSKFEAEGWAVIDSGKWGWGKNQTTPSLFFMERKLTEGEYEISSGIGFGTHIILN